MRPKISGQKNKKFQKHFRRWGKNFPARSSKSNSTFPEEHFREKHSLRKFHVNSQSFFELRLKNLRQNCKNCIFQFQRNIFEENFFETIYGSIDFVRASGEKFSTNLAILHSLVPEERSSTKLSVWKKYRFRNIFDVRVKIFQQDCQNQILHFQWNILAKIFSLKNIVNSQSFFERRVKNLRQVCKNWIFIIRGTFLKKSFFETHYGSIDFVRASGGNFSAGLSKLQFTFFRATLWEKGRKFLFNKNPFKIEFLRTSGEKFSGKAVKFHSNFQEEQFARKLFVRKKFNNSENFSGFGWKTFGKFVKTAFYKFRGTFMENTFVWKTLNVQIICAGFEWKVFSRVVKIAFFSQENTLREIFSTKAL